MEVVINDNLLSDPQGTDLPSGFCSPPPPSFSLFLASFSPPTPKPRQKMIFFSAIFFSPLKPHNLSHSSVQTFSSPPRPRNLSHSSVRSFSSPLGHATSPTHGYGEHGHVFLRNRSIAMVHYWVRHAKRTWSSFLLWLRSMVLLIAN